MVASDAEPQRRLRKRNAFLKGKFAFSIVKTPEGNPGFHHHPEPWWEVCYILSGEGRYFIEKTSYPMKSGDVFLVNDTEIHCVVTEKIERFTLLFAPGFVAQVGALEGLDLDRLFVNRPRGKPHLVLLDEGEKADFAYLTARAWHADFEAERGASTLCAGYMTAILAIVWRAFLSGRRRRHVFTATDKLVRAMAEYIDAHLQEALSLDKLAEEAGVSSTYFSSVFKRVTGMPLVTYITLKRLERAKELLRDTELKVSYISLEAGFNDLSHFNRVFKREMGVSPLQYRKICKE
ncbi:MAG: helix-turn-helix domain-containing protein [Kiritimatiellae bacterium]|nr:helix-turn-helix domain-containing protein [Kiritimatiellia bacterium]